MKVIICACVLMVAVCASVLDVQQRKFQAFKIKYGKTYRDQAEETKRFNIFKDKLRSIEQHNALYGQGLVSYKKGVNKFTDMSQEEFTAMLTFKAFHRPYYNATKHVKTGRAIPASVDWRTKGQVTEVKDQGDCASCWAFALIGSSEAAYYRKSGKLVSLSPQQLVDCTRDVNQGCWGGFLATTFPYIEKYGLESEESYPYTAVDGTCNYSPSDVVTQISGFKYTDVGDETALIDAVANVGPISTGLFYGYLQDYESGIFEDKRCSNRFVDHGVVVVGYGSENGKDFWIVKNSFGPDWGEEGYFRIIRGINECGISNYTAYPIID